MSYSCAFLFFLLFFSASAFAQDIGIIQCKPDATASVPAFNAAGKPFVVAQLNCGQTVRVVGVDRSFSPLSYSSRPAEYLIIQLAEEVGYVDSKSIRLLKSDEAPDAKKVEKTGAKKTDKAVTAKGKDSKGKTAKLTDKEKKEKKKEEAKKKKDDDDDDDDDDLSDEAYYRKHHHYRYHPRPRDFFWYGPP